VDRHRDAAATPNALKVTTGITALTVTDDLRKIRQLRALRRLLQRAAELEAAR
jgi:hypothetical protein